MAKSPKDTKGPVVKTGPTRGKNRSRNKDGRWRARRDDAGKSRSKKDSSSDKKRCFLTTVACEVRGLPDNCHQLETMRNFRDRVLLESGNGSNIVEEYYRIAPSLIDLSKSRDNSPWVWRAICKTVEEIEAQEYNSAILTYENMVRKLQLLKG